MPQVPHRGHVLVAVLSGLRRPAGDTAVIVKFSTYWALYAFPPITALLIVSVLRGAWLSAAWLVLCEVSAAGFYVLFDRADWPGEG
jgi:hypothetical protein